MDDEKKQRQEIYAEYRRELLGRQQSNSERFDGAILTLSAGALGLSIAFITDIVPISGVINLPLLVTSWALFAASMLATVVSYVTSQKGIDAQLLYAEEYYLNERPEFLRKRNKYAEATEWLNNGSGVCFVIAMVLTIVFAATNIYGASAMTDKNDRDRIATNGAVIPTMQAAPSQEISKMGATVPPMQPAPTAPQGGGTTQSPPASGGSDRK